MKRKVSVVDLPSWIEHLEQPSYIVLKLDVEGAEYDILDRMLERGTLSRINELYIEFHDGRVRTRPFKSAHYIPILESMPFAHLDTRWP